MVYYFAGYDPAPPDAVHRRFARELRRFEKTWSATSSVSAPEIGEEMAAWSLVTSGPNWRSETEFHLVRWDDLIDAAARRPMWQRLPLGILACLDFLWNGALQGYLRANWRYAVFFLYPFALLAAFGAIAVGVGALLGNMAESALAGVLAGALAFILLVYWPGRRLHLHELLDDWIFAAACIRRLPAVLDHRLDRAAQEIRAAAEAGEVDEILVIGHSLGAVLAVELLERALRPEASPAERRSPLVLLTLASSVLKIGLHRGARRFRAAVERVAGTPDVLWAEYQTVSDVMNFHKTEPLALMGLQGQEPVVRSVRVSRMLDAAAYQRIRRNLFRVHCQFVSGNTVRAAYDYFMLICGPLPAERQVRGRKGAASGIGEDGALLEPRRDRARERASR